MDETEFEKLTDEFNGDYARLLRAYNQLQVKYDHFKQAVFAGIAFIIFLVGYILYENSIWFAGFISGIWVFGIIGILAFVIIVTVIRIFKRRK